MARKKKKLSRVRIWAIIIAAVIGLTSLALIITNIFIPVKYLSSYIVKRERLPESTARVRFIDVGYGDSTLIELPDGKIMLIDGGSGRLSAQSRIIKFLNKSGVKKIDYLICSSVNSEHCGGLAEILKLETITKIYMPYCPNTYITEEFREFSLAAKDSGAEIIYSEYGAGESGEDYSFRILSPSVHTNPEGEYAQLMENPSKYSARNSASAVIWLECFETSFLFAGDAEDDVLSSICLSYGMQEEEYPAELENCDILKVANHGNKSSACAELYDLCAPSVAVVSVGKNGLNCPSAEAISNAINYVGEKFFRTDEHGTITVQVTKNGFTADGEKS